MNMDNELDGLIRKYFLLKKLEPDNELLRYYIKDKRGFMPNLELKEEFFDRFGGGCSSGGEFVGDRKKVSGEYTRKVICKIIKNYENAIDRELKELKAFDKEIMEFWGVQI